MFGKKDEKVNPDFEVFVIYDSKVGVYRMPIFAINKYDLIREFDRTFRDPQEQRNQYFTNAEDFALFKIGEYSKRSGQITPTTPEHIVNLHELRTTVQYSTQRANQQSEQNVSEVGIIPT